MKRKSAAGLLFFVFFVATGQQNTDSLLHALPKPGADTISLYRNLAAHFFNSGSYSEALNYHTRLLDHIRSIGDSTQVAEALFEIGRTHYFIRNQRSNAIAIQYLALALERASSYGDTTTLYRSHRGVGAILGEYYQNEKKYSLDTAIYHLDQAGILALAQGDYASASGVMCIIGEYLMEDQRELKLVGNYFQKALNYAQRSSDEGSMAYAYQKLGYFYTILGKQELADSYFTKALRIYEKLRSKDGMLNTLFLLKGLLKNYGDRERLVEVTDQIHLYSDSVYNDNTARAFAEMEVSYETEKKEQQIRLLSAEAQLRELQLAQNRFLLISILLIAFLMISGVLLYTSRKRYKLKATLADEKRSLQQSRFKSIIESEEKERKRIARELHDGLGQILSTARLTISSAENEDKDVKNSVEMIDHAISEVRNISHNMIPNALMTLGFNAAIEDLVRKINSSGKIRVVYTNNSRVALDEPISVALYRVIQELINNTLKYANAEKINIKIDFVAPFLNVHLEDNGMGFDVQKNENNNGMGLKNIHSRIELIGGQFNIFSKLNAGTEIQITVPIHESSHPPATR